MGKPAKDTALSLQSAIEHHRAGRLDEAENIYRNLLRTSPANADALHLLGVVTAQRGDTHEAERLVRKAISLNKNAAEFHNSLGKMLNDSGRYNEAIACLRKAIQLNAKYADAYNNLGNAYHLQANAQDAASCYRQASQLDPQNIEILINLGNALFKLQQIADAVECFNRAIDINPRADKTYFNFANNLKASRRFDEALVNYGLALEINPNLGAALVGIASIQFLNGDTQSVISNLRKAIHLQPEMTMAHFALGQAFLKLGHLSAAENSFREALRISPHLHVAGSALLGCLALKAQEHRADILAEFRRWNETFAAPLCPSQPEFANTREPQRQLKIGYVSPDFCRHVVSFFIEPILANHDKTQFEIHCYADVEKEDDFTQRLKHQVAQWHPITGMTDEAVANMVRSHNIDILVDLTGHSRENRLLAFARKPAPIQITYLGFADTTGLAAMDYRLTDHYADPEGSADGNYVEKLLRLPNSLWCFRANPDMPQVNPLPALKNQYLTFGSFNNYYKISEETILLWSLLLGKIPNSRLIMVTIPEGDAQRKLLDKFAAHGISPDRITIFDRLVTPKFLAMFQQVDIALDPYPIEGATTTCDALWMGVPVISLIGNTFLSRAGFSVLSAAGLQDFAAPTPEAYIDIAAHLASNIPLLAEIRTGLRSHVAFSPLADEYRFTRDLERLYREIWGKWCAENRQP